LPTHSVTADTPWPGYAATRALRESTSLASAPCVVHFCEIVSRYIASGQGEPTVLRLATVVAREARRRGLPAERMLTAFRIADCQLPRSHPQFVAEPTVALRYLRATRACLDQYFRTRPS
jgi:hypothetical protein